MNLLPVKCPGTRYLAFKSQVLISSGIASLDAILGGGIPMGSVTLIEEDIDGVYTRMLFKYLYAEGVASNHKMFIAALNDQERNIIYRLPALGDIENIENTEKEKEPEPEMKIAFRYKVYSEADSAPSQLPSANFGHKFDLSRKIPVEVIREAGFTFWPSSGSSYESVDSLIAEVSNWCKIPTDNARIVGLHSIGIPPWPSISELPKLLYKLRALAQTQTVTVVVSVPVQAVMDDVAIGRLEQLSDCVLKVESLADSENKLYSEYRGLINIAKFPTINSVATHVPETTDWAFKVLSSKFIIEKLHLPPDIGEDKSEPVMTGCHSARGSAIDF